MVELSIVGIILLFLVVGCGGFRQRISIGVGLLLSLGSVAIWQYDVWLSLFLGLIALSIIKLQFDGFISVRLYMKLTVVVPVFDESPFEGEIKVTFGEV